MCGITGFYLQGKEYNSSIVNENLNLMTKELYHRGPDDFGIWLSKSNKVGLGHTRLSIRDLSKNGSQPMFSSCGRYTIIYNGEIYDTEKMKIELKKQNVYLKSQSDTEILLESISKFGLNETLEKINGMFAFAVYDLIKKKLYLVRDRMGIKPLFYFKDDHNIAFGSEIKSIKKFFNFKVSLNIDVLNSFLKYGFNRQNNSIYKNIYQVKPGEIIEINESLKIQKKTYWNTFDIYTANKSSNSIDENILKLQELITDSVKIRLESDVEVGTFLSGGIDSSLISQIMSEISSKKINTFSVGFLEKDYDESKEAKEIANFIGSNHHEIFIDKNELINVFDNLPKIYDEPFADSSQIPTTIISSYAKKSVGVILSGDGGDELFGGYSRYIEANKQLNNKPDFKTLIKLKLSKEINKLNPKFINFLEKITNQKNLKSRSENFSNFYNSIPKDYSNFLCQFYNLNNILMDDFIKEDFSFNKKINLIKNSYERFMLQDLHEYLPNDILTKVDRASMKYGLEVRVPLLDYRIIKFASSININNKIFKNKQKIILKEILKKKLPKTLIKNKKMGFGIPLDKWLRTSLKERVDYLFSDECFSKNPYIQKNKVMEIWNEHLDQKQNHGLKLWNIICFQNWLLENKEVQI